VNVYPFIEAEKAGNGNVKKACELLEVSRSAYYQQRTDRPTGREQSDADLTEQIHRLHEKSRGRYGAPRIHAELRRPGPTTRPQTGRPADADRGSAGQGPEAVEEDHRARLRRGRPDRPDPPRLRRRRHPDQQPLVRRHHLHQHLGGLALPGHRHRHRLATRRRVRDGRPSAHRPDRRRPDQRRRSPRPPPGVVFHSDRGCQYTSTQYATLADDFDVRLSVGRTGQCWDNALAESFFASLKGECIDQQPWPTRAGTRRAVVDYIAWFNGTRLHSALDYLTPNEYEARPRSSPLRWCTRFDPSCLMCQAVRAWRSGSLTSSATAVSTA
jgi:putative transposase